MKKHNIRLIVDIAMTVSLPMLMAYSLIGETFHEIVGTAIFVLFIVHHVLNRKWYGALFRGKYNMRRIFQTTLDMLLLVFMILQPISGILMSKHLYTFLPALPISAQVRSIHMMLAYWGYMLGQTMFAFFDYSEPRVFFFLDYLAIMVLFMMIGCLIIYGLSKVHTKAEK